MKDHSKYTVTSRTLGLYKNQYDICFITCLNTWNTSLLSLSERLR